MYKDRDPGYTEHSEAVDFMGLGNSRNKSLIEGGWRKGEVSEASLGIGQGGRFETEKTIFSNGQAFQIRRP